jgi:hypothetical protein
LAVFINHLLSTLYCDSLLTDIPATGYWGLEGNEKGFMNLDDWDPRQANGKVYKVIALPVPSNPATLTPIYLQWAILGGSLIRTSTVKSIQLPSRETFEIRGSHLLVVVHYQVTVRVSNRKTRTQEIQRSLLVPTDQKVVDLAKAFQLIGNASRLFDLSDLWRNLQTDTRTAIELGWKYGTELRLEIK